MQTSFQRALEMAEARAAQRRAEIWRFWAGYEPDAVGACQSSTEAAALARVEVMARGRRTSPLTPLRSNREGRREIGIGGIGMADIMAAWRVACAEHDARRSSPPTPFRSNREGSGVVDRVIQWG